MTVLELAKLFFRVLLLGYNHRFPEELRSLEEGSHEADGSGQLTEAGAIGAETPEVFHTATPGYGSGFETPGGLNQDPRFGRALFLERILVSKEVELNWSGRGQHVEFRHNEKVPLQAEQVVGHSNTALVESVRCRRIRLARKSMKCRRGAKLEDLVKEIAYLHKLRHPHVVQLVGPYLQTERFAILMYPVASANLEEYMLQFDRYHENMRNGDEALYSVYERGLQFIWRSVLCLAHVVDYMHDRGIRHMDIKPSNILIDERETLEFRPSHRIFL